MIAEHSYKQVLIMGYGRLQDLIWNENLIFEQQRSLYLQNLMLRFIIPSIDINSNFKVQIGNEEYFKQIKNFTQCIFILKSSDIVREPSKTEPITVWEIFEVLFSLEYHQIILVLDKEEENNTFNQNYNALSSKFKEIMLKLPKLDIIYQDNIKLNDLLNITTRLRYPFIPKYIDSDTIFYITMPGTIKKDWIEIKLCNGVLYVGQKVYIGPIQYEIQSAQIHQQEIKIMVAPAILQIKVIKINETESYEIFEGMIGSRNLTKYVDQVKFTVYSIKQTQKEIEKKAILITRLFTSFKHLRGKKNILEQGQNQKNKFILSYENIQISFNQFNKLFFFSNLYRQLRYIGIIETDFDNALPPKQILLIPKQNFITQLQLGTQLENKNTFYSFCRFCKECVADTIIIPCGHFRYCQGCSVMLDECFFCEQRILNRIQINAMSLNHKQYIFIKQSTVTNWQIKSKNYQTIPNQLLIENEIIQRIDKKTNMNYKCQKCNQSVITHIFDCECGTLYVCECCNIEQCHKCKNSKLIKISYDFID